MESGLNNKNFAFIDGANLHKGVSSLGWSLDYKKFRVWLREKHHVETAYLFIGLIALNKLLYTKLQEAGYTLVFKETVLDGNGRVKGNCDADLVLWAVRGFYEKQFEQAVIVTSDGDYACLASFLKSKLSIKALISPGDHCSVLLMRTQVPITYMRDLKSLVQRK